MNFEKSPVPQEKKENTLENKTTNWEKSKKYLKMLALGGFVTLATLGGKKHFEHFEQKDADEKRDELRNQIENYETLWGSENSENMEMEKDTYAFINESDLFLKDGINKKESERFEVYLRAGLNQEALTGGSTIAASDGHVIEFTLDETKMNTIPVERSYQDIPTNIDKYTRPDHYIIFDNVPENNTSEQDKDLINIKIIDMETGKIREVFLPKDNNLEDVYEGHIPDITYNALANKVNEEKENL